MTEGLEIRNVCVRYGKATAVQSAGLSVRPGTLTVLVGPNGCGKTSLLNAVMGVIKHDAANITLSGRSLDALSPVQRVAAGLVLVPQGRQLFRHMTVRDNLLVVSTAFGIPKASVEQALDRFPILRERQKSLAGVLSGGEQQMLALTRALMCDPSMLLLDEPTLGLAPTIVSGLNEVLLGMRDQGKSILIAEPTMRLLPRTLNYGYIMLRGRIVSEGEGYQDLERLYSGLMGERAAEASAGLAAAS